MTTRIAPGVGANLIGQHSAEHNRDATVYVGNLDPQCLLEGWGRNSYFKPDLSPLSVQLSRNLIGSGKATKMDHYWGDIEIEEIDKIQDLLLEEQEEAYTVAINNRIVELRAMEAQEEALEFRKKALEAKKELITRNPSRVPALNKNAIECGSVKWQLIKKRNAERMAAQASVIPDDLDRSLHMHSIMQQTPNIYILEHGEVKRRRISVSELLERHANPCAAHARVLKKRLLQQSHKKRSTDLPKKSTFVPRPSRFWQIEQQQIAAANRSTLQTGDDLKV